MSYLKFDKEQLTNLEYSLGREILRTNRAGSYISTTISGCNTRKYHGLLVSPIEGFREQKHVLLSSLDVSVVQHGESFNLGIHRFQGGHYEPRGHKYLSNIEFGQIPKITYRVGGVILVQERILVEKKQQVIIRYTLEDAHSPTILRFRPFLAFRNIHSLSKANLFVNPKYEKVPDGIKMRLYEGYPFLHMQFNREPEFIAVPDWYYNIEYSKEKSRGYEFLEDLFVPGYFEIPVSKGESIYFSASTTEAEPSGLKRTFTKEISKKCGYGSFETALKNASSQFMMYCGDDVGIIAGFPWYGSFTRQSLVALPGILLALDNKRDCRDVIKTCIRNFKDGLLPNELFAANPQYDAADSPLWLVWAIQQYEKITGNDKEVRKEFWPVIGSVINGYRQGLPGGIRIRENGLVWAGSEKRALTWMDSYVNGIPVVQRKGYVVEINALWYNAVCYAIKIADSAGNKEFVEEWKPIKKKIKKSFVEIFWDEKKGYIADCADEIFTDWPVRPNMVIAAALEYSPLSEEQKKSVLSLAKKQLLTPRGLRTLSPDHPSYHGVIEGSPDERELAVHQGAVHPWLVQFFAEGYLKIHKRGGLPYIKKLIEGFGEELVEHCIGTISETYNGNPPHRAKGAISQAWNVAAVVYVNKLVEDYK